MYKIPPGMNVLELAAYLHVPVTKARYRAKVSGYELRPMLRDTKELRGVFDTIPQGLTFEQFHAYFKPFGMNRDETVDYANRHNYILPDIRLTIHVDFSDVDWSKSDREIALLKNCGLRTVKDNRKRLGRTRKK